MQRAEVMVGMTWIFLIFRDTFPRSVWDKFEARYFPSCAHVLIETKKYKQDEQTMNDKMEQLNRQMQALLQRSEDDQKKNDKVDNMEQTHRHNSFTRSSTDDVFMDDGESYVSTVPGAVTMADFATSRGGRSELANRQHAAPVDDYDEGDRIAKPAKDRIAENKEHGGYFATEQTVTEAAQTLQKMKDIKAAAAEKRTADMAKQINEMNKRIEVMKAVAARFAAEKKAAKPKETFF